MYVYYVCLWMSITYLKCSETGTGTKLSMLANCFLKVKLNYLVITFNDNFL